MNGGSIEPKFLMLIDLLVFIINTKIKNEYQNLISDDKAHKSIFQMSYELLFQLKTISNEAILQAVQQIAQSNSVSHNKGSISQNQARSHSPYINPDFLSGSHKSTSVNSNESSSRLYNRPSELFREAPSLSIAAKSHIPSSVPIQTQAQDFAQAMFYSNGLGLIGQKEDTSKLIKRGQVRYPFMCRKLIPPFLLNKNTTIVHLTFNIDPKLSSAIADSKSSFNYIIVLRSYKQQDLTEKHEWPKGFEKLSVNSIHCSFSKRTTSRTQQNLIRTNGENIPAVVTDKIKNGKNTAILTFEKNSALTNPGYIFELEAVAMLLKEDALRAICSSPNFTNEEFYMVGII